MVIISRQLLPKPPLNNQIKRVCSSPHFPLNSSHPFHIRHNLSMNQTPFQADVFALPILPFCSLLAPLPSTTGISTSLSICTTIYPIISFHSPFLKYRYRGCSSRRNYVHLGFPTRLDLPTHPKRRRWHCDHQRIGHGLRNLRRTCRCRI